MKALLDLPEELNRTLNIIKAQHSLKNKVEAIKMAVDTYKEEHMEPELRPEFIKKMQKGENKKGFKFKSVEELRKRY